MAYLLQIRNVFKLLKAIELRLLDEVIHGNTLRSVILLNGVLQRHVNSRTNQLYSHDTLFVSR